MESVETILNGDVETQEIYADGGITSNYCMNCESSVSSDLGRVLGDENGKVYGCPDCTGKTNLGGNIHRPEKAERARQRNHTK